MLKAATITRWCSKECSAFLCIFAWNLGGFLRSPWSLLLWILPQSAFLKCWKQRQSLDGAAKNAAHFYAFLLGILVASCEALGLEAPTFLQKWWSTFVAFAKPFSPKNFRWMGIETKKANQHSTMTMASCIAISGQRARLGNHNQRIRIRHKTVASDCILTGLTSFTPNTS